MAGPARPGRPATRIVGLAQDAEQPPVIDAAVAGHREHAVDHRVEKALVAAARLGQHGRPDVLAVDVRDAFGVAASDVEHVPAGVREVPRVQEQAHGRVRHLHEPVDLGLRLHDGSHVMVIRKAQSACGEMLGDLAERRAELRPIVLGQPRPPGEGDAQPPVHTARLLGEDDGRAPQRGQKPRVLMHRGDLLLRPVPEEMGAIPARHEVEAVLPENDPQLHGPPWELPTELDPRVSGLARLRQTRVEGRVVAKRFEVIVGPADWVDADSNGHASLAAAGDGARRRRPRGRPEPRVGPRPRERERPTTRLHP